MNKSKIAISLLLFWIASASHAQYFITGQDPGSTKWQQIRTTDFQVIFPDNYSKWAQYYINALKLSGPVINENYKSKIRRIPVVLHNHTTASNAYAAIAPMRLDFFEMPPQNSYPQIWQDQLALHEYRHTVQQYKMRQGMTKGLYYIFGDQGAAFILGLYLPFWFMEGDAVYSETIYSSSGRGRVPDFIYPLKAQVLDKKIYKYDKAVYGSFRDFVPDHYTLGYQLMARGVDRYGIEMWDKTMNLVARRPYYILPFTISIKQQTGEFKVRYFNTILNQLKQEWWIHDKQTINNALETLSPENKYFTNYLFASQMEDGALLAEKTTIDDINRFVKIDTNGREKRLFTPGFDFMQTLSHANNLVCWNERTYDPRWEMRNYSVIKLFDLETRKQIKLTKKSRYFAPHISNTGKRVVAVHVSRQMDYALHIIDTETGEVIRRKNTKDNLFFMTPHWSNDDRFIVTMVLGKKGKSIALWDIEKDHLRLLMPFTFTEIKWPVIHDDWVVFTGTFEGKDDLYVINAGSGETYRLLESRFGANYASFSNDGEAVFFSYYTADGHKLSRIDFAPEALIPFDFSQRDYQYLADRLTKPNTFNLDLTHVPDSNHKEKKYRKGGHLFNLHSWAPVALDVDNYTINPGATLLSQNNLSSAVTSISYRYDLNERTSKIEFGFDYSGLYPVIGFKVDYGGRKGIYRPNADTSIALKWRETNLSLSLSVPLNFTSSVWIKGIQPIVGISQKFRQMEDDIAVRFVESNFTVPVYRFYAYNQYKRSPKDIYPKWGQSLDIIYRDTPFSDFVNSQFGIVSWFYFPGFIRHQGLRVYGGYQKTIANNYSFSNFVAVPRGYSNIFLNEYVSLRTDYAFPVAHPDWNVPGAFYLKRIYSKVFYDYLVGEDSSGNSILSSTGLEVYTDWHFLSILLNINLGIRLSHRFENGTQFYEFLFGFSY